MNNLIAARLAHLVYDDRGRKQKVKALGLTWLDYVDISGSEAIFVKDTDSYIVAFAGSRDRVDWIRNVLVFDIGDLRQAADFAPLFSLADAPGRVHTGFMRALSVIAEELKDWIRQAAVERKRVTLIGHSLGAAEAALFAYFLPPTLVDKLFLFGCPPIGDKEFIESFPVIAGTQFICGFDPVPRVVEIANAFSDRNPIQLLLPPLSITTLASSLSWWKKLIPYYWKDDHRMESYEAGLGG